MTPKQITTLAGHRLLPPWVMKLALEVAAAEREACAKVCEENGKEPDDHKSYEGYNEGYQDGSNNCAAAIRGRSHAGN